MKRLEQALQKAKSALSEGRFENKSPKRFVSASINSDDTLPRYEKYQAKKSTTNAPPNITSKNTTPFTPRINPLKITQAKASGTRQGKKVGITLASIADKFKQKRATAAANLARMMGNTP